MKKIQITALQFFLLSLLLIGVVGVQSPLAQGTTGTILGVVEDESQAVLPGVTVTATNIETNQSRTVISDDEGRYRLPQLPLGPYEVQAELTGFSTEVRRPITLTIASEAVVDFSLSIGQITERVVVTGEASLVETTSAVTSGLVDDKKIRDLPLNGRDFAQLALLQEGVVNIPSGISGGGRINRTQAGNEGVKIALAGTRITQSAFLLDGTDIRNHMGGVPAGATGAVAGVETVREFKVITGAYSAEYGRFSGGVITAVTKSGTNDVHGSIYEFHRNSALDARNFFDRDPQNPTERSDVPEFKRNQFGFSLGGPIVPDKTFVFGSYEGFRQRLLNTEISIVPSQPARDGLLFGPVSPEAQPYIDLYPEPNGRDLGRGLAESFNAERFPVNQDLFTVRVDHQFSDSDSFFARYTFDESDKQTFDTPQTDLVYDYRYQYLTLSEKKIITPNLINEAKFGFVRSKNIQQPIETVAVDPSLRFSRQPEPVIGRFFGAGLSSFGAFLQLRQFPTNFQYSDDLSYTRGRHFLKMGVHFTRFQYNVDVGVRTHGVYIFTSIPGLLSGAPLRFDGFSTAAYLAGMRQNLFGFYIQDDWKFSPRLTLNLGLRYEFITIPTEVGTGESIGMPEIEGRIANLVNVLDSELHVGNPYFEDNPSLKNFSPRIGFAWDVFGNGKTSLRGGAGVFYNLFLSNVYQASPVFNPPFALRITAFRPDFGPNADPYSSATALPSLWAMGDVKQAYMMTFSLTLQQEIMPQTVLTVGYQGSQGRKLGRLTNDANLAVPIKYDASQFPNGPGPEFNGRTYFPYCAAYAADGSCSSEISLPKRNPAFAGIRMELWDANSFYNSFKIGVNRRFSSSLQFQMAYNNSKTVDDSSNVGHFDSSGDLSSVDPDDRKLSRGLSAIHNRHAFSFNFSYDLPGQQSIFGGWQLNGILTAATGSAATLDVGFDPAHSQQAEFEQRPELISGSNNPVLADGRDPNQYYDTSGLAVAEEGFFGSLGRNTLITPGLITFDLGVTKNFKLHEEATLQFKAEFFNLFNRVNFGLPGLQVFNSRGLTSNAGLITDTITTSRQIQLALKLLF